MARTNTAGTDAAARAWRLMFSYFLSTSPARERSLESRGLTPNDARALWALDETQGRAMGALARQWGCDPSNATFIVKRLERLGLAERHRSPQDSRVKLVRLTPLGARLKAELLAEYHLPPPGLEALAPADLAALEAIFQKLAPSSA
ncbi:DNA-binding MarR family transcriptional regulator [Caulobacter ginsengisoli]|uniref:DNA-binding MarR family transcriptional regulator n=1 Tax=Caulobacter ginsengisoli TaxID=400775 RepID=A0ABU0IVG9_9CAUL|nr:MarR family transcriptional regulator [Caulobacter ginsengisoli]MDQ0466016.1 DNA-binding MarR family transcriptional regulator [Caulobacter ginsengisoli]